MRELINTEYCDKCGFIKEQCECEKTKTNADRIRSMSDYELGQFLEQFGTFNQPCNLSPGEPLKYLQSEVEEYKMEGINNRYLFRAKRTDNGEWVEGLLTIMWGQLHIINPNDENTAYPIDTSTICQCTGLKNKNGKLIWENDILMCHGNRNDLVKAVFGEFCVINAGTLEKIDRVIGWHYEVLPTDALSRCEPFCLSMPLTAEYIRTCEFETIGNIFDNPELLEVGK